MRKMKLFLISLGCMFHAAAQSSEQYTNPILAGFYPDPSICRAGKDYYLVNSSFAYYPGLPIFHSTDLVNWKQIGHAMDRPEQLDLEGAGVSRGLFAPDITFHKGKFYIVCTLIDKGGNFVITATNPAGPWSKPTWLKEVDGIDPSLFFDDNDSAYILYNSVPPGNHSLYDGHRTIRIRNFDYRQLKAGSTETIIINGGTDISRKPVWIEGPHLYRKDGWLYLLCAEGGTGYNHSEVVFRGKNPEGPYEVYSGNPILTQRQLDPARKNPITTTGHADMVETPGGKWYAVFLGCRPYKDDYVNTGRETFMAPVHWTNGWPVITKGNEEVQYYYPLPSLKTKPPVSSLFNGNFTYRNNFDNRRLDPRFIFLRTRKENWFSLTTQGYLSLQLRKETISGSGNPSFVAHRQQHLSCTVSTALRFQAKNSHEKAGLVIFQNEHHFYYLCISISNGQAVVQLFTSTEREEMQLMASAPLHTSLHETGLRIRTRGPVYDFYFTENGKDWKALKENVDATFLSTRTAGGFVGCVFAMYATSSGQESHQYADYNWFEYKGEDPVLK